MRAEAERLSNALPTMLAERFSVHWPEVSPGFEGPRVSGPEELMFARPGGSAGRAVSSCLVLPEAACRCRQSGGGALWFATRCDHRLNQEEPLHGGDTVQRAKQFDRKAAADRFAASVETDKARGSYVDPKAGRMTLKEYGEAWL